MALISSGDWVLISMLNCPLSVVDEMEERV